MTMTTKTRASFPLAAQRRLARAIQALAREGYLITPTNQARTTWRLLKIAGDNPEYTVRLDGLLPSCTCPDYRKHGQGHLCKHVFMARLRQQALAYAGVRTREGCVVYVFHPGQAEPLAHHVRHSPTGFEWGYHGSGPADLAFSILAHYAGVELAEEVYQDFKGQVVARLPHLAWVLTADEVERTIQHILGEFTEG